MKERADRWLLIRGLFPSREKARRAVMAGDVMVGTDVLDKPSRLLTEEEAQRMTVRVRDRAVSRAYYKLDHALSVFPADAAGKHCIDVGASTGGFTQCLLDAGAASVYAVDCGTNQLDYRLRADKRVVVMEKTNARYLEAAWFSPLPELAVMDVSFISISLILPVLADVLCVPDLVSLIKPHFEAGRTQVGKGGVIREPGGWEDVLARTVRSAAASGYGCPGLTVSPITGGEGNVEFLGHFIHGRPEIPNEVVIREIVGKAVDLLRSKRL